MGNILKPKRVCNQNPEILKNIISHKHLTAINSRRQARNAHVFEIDKSSTNPFFVFFLKLRQRKPDLPVTKLARVAGRRWRTMSFKERDKYVQLAATEKKRRVKSEKRANKCPKIRSKGACRRKRGANERDC